MQQQEIKSLLDKEVVNKKDIEILCIELFQEWNFKYINDLLLNNLIDKNYIDKLILKNNNLTACFYMLGELDDKEKIFFNIDSLIEKSKKNIHIYNLTISILRNFINYNNNLYLSLNIKDILIDLYLKHTDFDNLYLLIDKLVLNSDNNLEILILLANKLQENITYKNEFKEFISRYISKEKTLVKTI